MISAAAFYFCKNEKKLISDTLITICGIYNRVKTMYNQEKMTNDNVKNRQKIIILRKNIINYIGVGQWEMADTK